MNLGLDRDAPGEAAEARAGVVPGRHRPLAVVGFDADGGTGRRSQSAILAGGLCLTVFLGTGSCE